MKLFAFLDSQKFIQKKFFKRWESAFIISLLAYI